MKRILFVTGTDTGVGKTTVSVALLAAWAKTGRVVRPLKPIETGITDGTEGSDAARLAAAVGLRETDTALLRFSLPAAPECAAAAEGQQLALGPLVATIQQLPGENLLIEGAGGLLVPIAPGVVMADLAQALGARLLIVGRTRLGTINHTLLTLAESQRRGLPVCALILNRLGEEVGPQEADTAARIAAHGGVQPLGPFPFSRQQDPATLADLAAQHLPIDTLFERAFLS